MKEYNLKQHYGTEHAVKCDVIQGQLRFDKMSSLVKKYLESVFNFKKNVIKNQKLVLKVVIS